MEHYGPTGNWLQRVYHDKSMFSQGLGDYNKFYNNREITIDKKPLDLFQLAHKDSIKSPNS